MCTVDALLIALIISIVVIVILIGAIVAVVLYRRRRKTDVSFMETLPLENIQEISGITVQECIATGNFAQVFRGDWNGTPVALKLLKDPKDFAEFYREREVLQ